MTNSDDHAARVLDALRMAVAAALERKQRLGHYAVYWNNGRSECIGPDAPTEVFRYPDKPEAPQHGVAES